MCGGAPVLRIVATVFLVIAFVAALLGYVAPFWTERIESNQTTTTTPRPITTTIAPIIVPQGGPTIPQPKRNPSTVLTPRASASSGDDDDGKIFHWEGLWVKCHQNLSCECFAQNDFAMEIAFKAWHKAAQGLFGIGLIILLVAIVTISFNICCCRCCKGSMAIATACGILTVIGLFVILAALAVYGAFSYIEHGVGLTGPKVRFFWGFYLSIAAAGLAILPAILFICDGRREELPEHEDCETAKMV